MGCWSLNTKRKGLSRNFGVLYQELSATGIAKLILFFKILIKIGNLKYIGYVSKILVDKILRV
jgi:hypothetical protein